MHELIDHVFVKERFGVKTAVILKAVKTRKVVLGFQGRTDTFTVSHEEFKKHYRQVGTSARVEPETA